MGPAPTDPPGAAPGPYPVPLARPSVPWYARPWFLLGALVVAALAIRLPTAGAQSFWLDEVYTGRIVDGSLGHAWSTIQETENTPPLFYLLDWLVGRLLGTGELALRSLSAVAGALAVIPVVALARRVARGGPDAGHDDVGPRGPVRRVSAAVASAVDRGTAAHGVVVPAGVALGAGALLAVNPLGHWFAQEARSYALFVLLSAMAWTALLAAASRPTRRRLWLWALAAVATAWTHYFGGLLLVVGWGFLAVVLLGRARGPALRALRSMAVPAACSVAAVAALVPVARNQRSTGMYEAISRVKGLPARIVETPKQFALGYSAPAEIVVGFVLALVLGVLVLAGAWPRAGRATRGTVLLGLCAGVWLLPIAALAGGFDVVLTRNLVLLVPPLVVLATLGAWRLGRRALVLLGAVGVVQLATVVLVAVTPVYQREDWRGILRAAEAGRPSPGLLFIDQYQGPAATYYSPTLQDPAPDGVPVRSVAVIDRLEDGEALERVAPPPAPPGFVLARTEQRDQYRVFVWDAPRPTPVDPNLVNLWRSQPPRSVLLRP